ncbi:hypothetical protein CDAR_187731 [Caerostris darwini]|uniref:Uncharacterized protein n=1 Tax=Caerostris darwini TaxID=1538125 RepID=A0AAV4RCC6_9ARAC|nr:hypothetical protein CDAR_187731 [Caerostris darwini]
MISLSSHRKPSSGSCCEEDGSLLKTEKANSFAANANTSQELPIVFKETPQLSYLQQLKNRHILQKKSSNYFIAGNLLCCLPSRIGGQGAEKQVKRKSRCCQHKRNRSLGSTEQCETHQKMCFTPSSLYGAQSLEAIP